jgi:ribosomal protein L11 methyltransferase
LIRLAVRCLPEHADRVLAELVELVPDGVEEDRGESYVEFAIYGAPGELPELPDLEAAAGSALVEIETTEIPDDWADAWRDFHRPILVGERLLVRPSWEESAKGSAEVEIVIDPGQAFGTGAHHTTRMCLELLLGLVAEGVAPGPAVDWGTGSGVLAIAAAKLGFEPVAACDSEIAAVEAAAANAWLNGVELELSRVNLREVSAPVAATVVANLTAPILLAVAGRLSEAPRRVICSGALESEADAVAAAFRSHGLEEKRRLSSGGWAALHLEKTNVPEWSL